MPRLSKALIVIATALALFPAPNAEAAGRTQIAMAGTQFVPAVTQVAGGTSVVWVNSEVANYPAVIGNHNIVPDSATAALPDTKPFPTSSALIAPGGTWECPDGTCTGADGKPVKLPPGRYAYMCGIHPNQMHGILVVT